MYLMNLGKPTKVAKLNEAMAIELGANLMGEVIIFSVAGGCIMLEYYRQAAKEAKKEELRLAQLEQFTNEIELLQGKTTKQEMELERLESIVAELANRAKIKISKNISSDSTGSKDRQPRQVEERRTASEQKGGEAVGESEALKGANQSLVNRAIVYFENDVRRDKLS